MLEFLANLSVIFILLALFGFFIKDAYHRGEIGRAPFSIKGDFQTFCHYTSFSLLIFAGLIISLFIIFFAPNENNLVTQTFFSLYDFSVFLEGRGILPVGFTNSSFNALILLFFPALFFIGSYATAFSFGRLRGYISRNWVGVYYKDEKYEEFPRIVSENSEFITFEDNEKDHLWTSIQKHDIKKLKSIDHPSKYDFYKKDIHGEKFYYPKLVWFFCEKFLPIIVVLIFIILSLIFK